MNRPLLTCTVGRGSILDVPTAGASGRRSRFRAGRKGSTVVTGGKIQALRGGAGNVMETTGCNQTKDAALANLPKPA